VCRFVANRTLVLTLLVSLAGCATKQIALEKPTVTPVDRQQDENACLRAAVGGELDRQLLAPYRIDRDLFMRCMEGRGYTAKPR
jgi:hypothetical protein